MEPIAIIGMGCLFPGAETPGQYWDNLLARRDCSSDLSEQELGVPPSNYHHPVPGTPDRIHYNRNGHVRGFQPRLDGWQVPADELRALDPLFHWTLHAAAQALEDAGHAGAGPQLRRRCGLVIGNIGMPTHSGKRLMAGFYQRALQPYLQALLGRPDFRFHPAWEALGLSQGLSEANLLTGSHNATVAARALGLGGPCFALDAACASALYAIQVAGSYLHSGKADLMLAGSVCHADHVYIDHGFNVLQAFPREGRSIPFDRRSEGLKAGEGAGLVALKRLSDAQRDGDTIHGVIESIGLSNDAGAKHILVPDVEGQLLALQRAYDGRDRRIDYLECHATGTPVGDEVELGSAEAFFSEAGGELPLVGANKGNIGHMLTASGMASILKVLLAMRHGVIPPTIGVEEMVGTPAARLGLGHVVREATPWPRGGARARAGINAFGFGGVNGHMVLARHEPAAPPAPAAARAPGLALQPLAIVGLGVTLAGTDGVAAFDAVVREGASRIGDLPPTRWIGLEGRADLLQERGLDRAPEGAYIEALDFDCQHFKLPPKVVGSHLLSHLFLMPVAEQAFLDAGYELGKVRRNISVIVAGDVDHGCLRYQARNEIAWQLRDSLQRSGIELDAAQAAALEDIAKEALFPAPYPEGITGGIGNVVASRIAAHLRLNGPAFALCAHENAVFKAVEVAQFMLSQGLVEAVIVASGSFAGGMENVLWSHGLQGGQPVGEGAGVLVLKREQDAVQARDRIYALLRGLAIEHATGDAAVHADDVARAATAALAQAGVRAQDVGLVELGAPGRGEHARARADGLDRAYAGAGGVHAGSVSTNYGDLGAAQGVLGIVKAALCLHGRHLPAGSLAGLAKPDSDGPRLSRPQEWAAPPGGTRWAAVNGTGLDRAHAHLLLQEAAEDVRRAARAPAAPPTRKGGLVVRVHTGRDRSMADIVLSDDNRRLFPHARPQAPANTGGQPFSAALTTDPLVRQYLRNARSQLRFLEVEQAFYRRMTALLDAAPAGLPESMEPPPRRDVLFDEAQLVELTDGSVERVLGPDYREADSYPIRTRMPSPPYMFVSRITAMSAQKGKLEPCFVEWEYDLSPEAWFAVDGRVGSFVALESSHAMIVAFTWIGCDQLFKGELRYRAVDSQTTVYAELPRAGEVLRGRVDIKSFIRVGRNVLISYVYECRAGDRLCFRLEANSGFFLPKDMEKSKGVDPAPYLKVTQDRPAGRPLRPLLHCERTSFGPADIDALLRGDFAPCFGPAYAREGVARLHAQDARMLERVVSISADGGAFGLGEAVGECEIDPGHWAFKAHFKNDPVMPGTMLVEGCWQLANFFLCWLGLYSRPHIAAQELVNHRYSAKFRGEVKCQRETLCYRLTCKSVERGTFGEGGVKLVFVAEIIYRGNVIGVCDNLGAAFAGRVDADDAPAAVLQPAIEV